MFSMFRVQVSFEFRSNRDMMKAAQESIIQMYRKFGIEYTYGVDSTKLDDGKGFSIEGE